MFPRHPAEFDRLDVQHYALAETLGASHLAPVANPARVLDVGAGTGQWAFDLCALFPRALVVGLDLVPGRPRAPAGYRFVLGDLLQGLPFASDRFDFVHQRLLFSGVPLRRWPDVVADLLRVTRSGGWVELVEGASDIGTPGPATARMLEHLARLGRSLGLDSMGFVHRSLDRYLRDAGAVEVTRRPLTVPLGEWGGRTGSLMATAFRAMFTRLSLPFQAELGVPEAECLELLAAMPEEWERLRSTYDLAVAFGRKPPRASGQGPAAAGPDRDHLR